ncbi:MAG: HAMP domain-containing sensor histidine kinase [bacterium]|nr:HAMP domain-containing sensor histidine kinase [bacterium]
MPSTNSSSAPSSSSSAPNHKRRNPRQIRLSVLIASGYFIPLCVTLIIIGVLLQQQITSRLWTSTQQRMTDAAFTTVGVHLNQLKPQEVQDELLDRLGDYTPFTLVEALDDANQSARIIDISGATLAQGGHRIGVLPMPLPQKFDEAKMLEPLEPPYSVCWIDSDSNGNKVFCLLIPLSLNGFPDVFLQLFSSWRVAEDITNTLNNLMVWGGLGSLLLSVIFSLLIGRRLSQPLEQLAKTAKIVENGDLSARTGIVCHQRELSDVAEAFDQMVSQLEKSFASQKRFVADASHELKTPLTAISGMAELMEDASEEERQRSLAVMNREIGRMSRLVNDLLYLSRAENAAPGSMPGQLEDIDLHKLLREVVASAQPVNFDKEIILSPQVKATVHAHSDSLARIFHNLIGNAQKYAPGDSPIEITCQPHKTEVSVSVRDHGPGIPEKDLPRVFERFFRSDASRNRKTGGSGLGLAIVQALTESAGGHTSIRNHPEGGLEITVTLPLAEESAE